MNNISLENLFTKTKYVYKKIDIIVPIYNGFEYLENLFSQIKNYTDLDYELYVIDDKSPDVRVLPLLKKFEKIFGDKMHLIENETNIGFLKSVNKALAIAQHDVCIINTDIQLPQNWATRLMYYIFSNDNIASVTPFSNAATIFSFPKMWIDNDLVVDYKIIDNMFSEFSLDAIPLLEFPTGVGFCMAMSRNALDKIGFFDEIFEKGYSEENDWCMRALKAGFKNVLCPNLFVYHKHGGSFDSEEKKELCEKHLKILSERYPEYARLVGISSQNGSYMTMRNIAMKRYEICLFKNGHINILFKHIFSECKIKNFIQNIFSIKNKNKHKIITVLGIKIKFKSKKLLKNLMFMIC